jgi:protein-S-isoprenylcysteine O-methyltransferase Ste14
MASFDAAAPLGPFSRTNARTPCANVARRVWPIVSRAALVSLFFLFASANYSHWRATGAPSGLGATLLEGWVALLFLVRRSTDQFSRRPLAWVAAAIGSCAMMLARPGGSGLPQLPCEVAQLLGVLIALVSLAALGRSFGLVAADRGLKTRGPYRLVRHPAYAGYLVCYVAYVAENPAARNVALLLLSTVFQLVRINEEERVLAADSSYASYRRNVKRRLIPRVY